MKRRVVLAGNPNVGKSTIFNALTGMHQHVGNWAGVTVSCATGTFEHGGTVFSVIDLPGIYSYDTRTEEEAVTKQFVEAQEYDVLVLVCDATCLERGLHLLRQTLFLLRAEVPESSPLFSSKTESGPDCYGTPVRAFPPLLLCVNLCDEAEEKGICIDFPALEQELKIPVIPCCARERDSLERLKAALCTAAAACGDLGSDICACTPRSGDLPSDIDVCPSQPGRTPADTDTCPSQPCRNPSDFSPETLAAQTVTFKKRNYRKREETLDRFFTGRITGTLCMLLLLTGVFWLTITGANYPSSLLWELFFRFETLLVESAFAIGLPQWFAEAAIYGVYRVVAWIVSVMLPPMAIFFPLFTLMEDFGLLPRIAYNMDGAFHSCGACGKQCLTMAMGLGCNAAGVTGCRIIDSPRERLIAILTNSLVPCNGRFPLLITMISLCALSRAVFAAGGGGSGWSGVPDWSGALDATVQATETGATGQTVPLLRHLMSSLLPALALTGFLLLGIAATLAVSHILSHTLLKGMSSSFTLELPPYRRPQIGKVLVRSIFDRTLFVLGRAVVVAAPAGLLIWIMANLTFHEQTLLQLFSGLLEPFGRLMGLDGVILMAFILGFPANEIVLPIILMAYMQSGTLVELEDTNALFQILTANGWTLKTFVCMAVFSLFHWPCSTTCLTIRKETGSWRWTAAAILIPTLLGIGSCILTGCIMTSTF